MLRFVVAAKSRVNWAVFRNGQMIRASAIFATNVFGVVYRAAAVIVFFMVDFFDCFIDVLVACRFQLHFIVNDFEAVLWGRDN